VPVEAGRRLWMQEAHERRVANHLDPESCAEAGSRLGEAVMGGRCEPAIELSHRRDHEVQSPPWRVDPHGAKGPTLILSFGEIP